MTENTNTTINTQDALKALRRTMRTAAESAARQKSPVETSFRLGDKVATFAISNDMDAEETGPARYNPVRVGFKGANYDWDTGRAKIAEDLGLTYKGKGHGSSKSAAKALTPEEFAARYGTNNPPLVSVTDELEDANEEAAAIVANLATDEPNRRKNRR